MKRSERAVWSSVASLAASCIALCWTSCYEATASNRFAYTYEALAPLKPDFSFSNDTFSIAFNIGDKSVGFRLNNRGQQTIKLIWDEAVLVQFGQAKRVMHEGVKYVDRNQSMPPSILPPGASLEDEATPTDNVYYREGFYSQYSSYPGGWETHDLFIMDDLGKEQFKNGALMYKGAEFSLHLPLMIGDGRHDYDFNFKVQDVKVIPSTQPSGGCLGG